jgi:hypothetical protein
MNRRLVAFLIVLAMTLQGPILSYAATMTAAESAMAMPADCCPGHGSDHANHGFSCCPAGLLAAACCAGPGIVAAILPSHVTLPAPPLHLLPWESGSVSYATESPGPQLRPPIV